MPGKMKSEAIMRQKEKILSDSHSRPMKANTCVAGDAHLSALVTMSLTCSAVSAIFCEVVTRYCSESRVCRTSRLR